MSLPDFSMRELLEAGVHFGHKKERWNPKMETFIYGKRNGIHIIDLSQTVPLLHQALLAIRDVAASGGRVLFVGTKRQASEHVAESAKKSAQYYINHTWMAGILTNWKTVSNSIKRFKDLEETINSEKANALTKKEVLKLTREHNKLERAIGGIKDMGGLPDILFVIDTNKEAIAILEANKLGIPVVAILDTNSTPDNIDHPIPGNDDASRAIALYCSLAERAILDGMQNSEAKRAVDQGESLDPLSSDDLEVLNQESKGENITEGGESNPTEEPLKTNQESDENKELIVEKKKRVSPKKKVELSENGDNDSA
ncbi:MAG: 30S ribosomal protein S2 [Rhodobiaceae bacterium]|nr:30S ribosomal protein S2 [Rhodobiaceae bacterium]|tara:strand:+ start:2538 stop:3476 length:939 start_codon:yes stop_codon:yes gene_type:complete